MLKGANYALFIIGNGGFSPAHNKFLSEKNRVGTT
jgi:hypothetical protein